MNDDYIERLVELSKFNPNYSDLVDSIIEKFVDYESEIDDLKEIINELKVKGNHDNEHVSKQRPVERNFKVVG